MKKKNEIVGAFFDYLLNSTANPANLGSIGNAVYSQASNELAHLTIVTIYYQINKKSLPQFIFFKIFLGCDNLFKVKNVGINFSLIFLDCKQCVQLIFEQRI